MSDGSNEDCQGCARRDAARSELKKWCPIDGPKSVEEVRGALIGGLRLCAWIGSDLTDPEIESIVDEAMI